MQQWVADGGLEKLQTALAQTDAETAASPEWQAVKEDLRQHYIEADAMPEAADKLATSNANIYGNLARNAGMSPVEMLSAYGKFRFWDSGYVAGWKPFFKAVKTSATRNAINARWRIISGDEWNPPAVVLNPDGYAYMRKAVRDLQGDHWDGAHIHPDEADEMLDHVESESLRLPKRAGKAVVALVQAIRETRTKAGGAILLRDGMPPDLEALSLGEERGHAFQHLHPVSDAWLRVHPEAAKRPPRQ